MSDLPDEVLIDRRMHAWRPGDWHLLDRREGQVRYVRADLYEQAGEFDHQDIDPADLGQHFADAMQALTTRNAVSKAACAQLIAEQAQRAEQAKAERDMYKAGLDQHGAYLAAANKELTKAEAGRDRLRAVLDRVRELAEDGKTSACAMQVCEDIELIAQEALGHD